MEGGGGRGRGTPKRFCARKHITNARPEVPYGRGPALGGLDALSCYLGIIFNHSDTKLNKNIVDQILGGGGRLLRPPLDLHPPLYCEAIMCYRTGPAERFSKWGGGAQWRNEPKYLGGGGARNLCEGA